VTTLGHGLKLMPPVYVKPYAKRRKNGAADAEAICEAVQRPGMRFVPVKHPEQQARPVLHRTLHLLIRQPAAVSFLIGATGAVLTTRLLHS
jgi:transposase